MKFVITFSVRAVGPQFELSISEAQHTTAYTKGEILRVVVCSDTNQRHALARAMLLGLSHIYALTASRGIVIS